MTEDKAQNAGWIKVLSIIVGAIISVTTVYVGFVKESKIMDDATQQTLVNNFRQQLRDEREYQDEQREKSDKVVAELEEKVNALTVLYTDCGAVNTNLRIENERLKSEAIIRGLYTGQQNFAEWEKGTNFLMKSLNKMYEDLFLIPIDKKASDYIGYNDYDVFSTEIADRFRKHDRMVLSSRKTMFFEESVVQDGKRIKLLVVKFPKIINNKIVSLKGYAFIID